MLNELVFFSKKETLLEIFLNLEIKTIIFPKKPSEGLSFINEIIISPLLWYVVIGQFIMPYSTILFYSIQAQ